MRTIACLVASLALLVSACGDIGPTTTSKGAASETLAIGARPPAASLPLAQPSPSARRSPTPPLSPSAKPELPTTEPTGEVSWRRIGTTRAPNIAEGYGVYDVAGFDDGYVLVDGSPIIKASEDGMAWTTVQPPLSYGIVVALKAAASNGKSLIVGGSYSPCTRLAYNANPFFDCRARPVSWVSRDGRTWKASGPWTGRLGPRGKAGSDFVALWGVPSGGWDAAQLFSGSDESDDLEPTGPAIWHSDDGRTWTVRNARDAFRDWPCWVDTEASWHFAADQSGRRLASVACYSDDGTDEVAALASSLDGRTWARIAGFESPPGSWISGVVGPAGDDTWVVAGAGQFDAMAWSSRDLANWTATQLPVPTGGSQAAVWTLARADGTYVAAGRGGEQALTWLSADGVTWRLAVAARGHTPIEELADGPAGLLAFGLMEDKGSSSRYHLAVWRMDLLR